MFKVDGEKLSLTRGDDAYLYVGATLAEGESLLLRVYKDKKCSLLQFERRQHSDGSFLLFGPDVPFGDLYYQIFKVDENGNMTVVLGPGTLTITEEVH